MANVYTNKKASLTSSGATTLYTVPANSRAIVKSLLVAEDASSTATVEVTLTNASGTAFVVDKEICVAAMLNKLLKL